MPITVSPTHQTEGAHHSADPLGPRAHWRYVRDVGAGESHGREEHAAQGLEHAEDNAVCEIVEVSLSVGL